MSDETETIIDSMRMDDVSLPDIDIDLESAIAITGSTGRKRNRPRLRKHRHDAGNSDADKRYDLDKQYYNTAAPALYDYLTEIEQSYMQKYREETLTLVDSMSREPVDDTDFLDDMMDDKESDSWEPAPTPAPARRKRELHRKRRPASTKQATTMDTVSMGTPAHTVDTGSTAHTDDNAGIASMGAPVDSADNEHMGTRARIGDNRAHGHRGKHAAPGRTVLFGGSGRIGTIMGKHDSRRAASTTEREITEDVELTQEEREQEEALNAGTDRSMTIAGIVCIVVSSLLFLGGIARFILLNNGIGTWRLNNGFQLYAASACIIMALIQFTLLLGAQRYNHMVTNDDRHWEKAIKHEPVDMTPKAEEERIDDMDTDTKLVSRRETIMLIAGAVLCIAALMLFIIV